MSRIPYTINVDEYICTALEQIRKMNENRDYSGLAAAVERIQYHASKMEEALYSYENLKHSIKNWLDDKDITPEQFREKCKEASDRIHKNHQG